jgi:hypothetical protein
MRLDRHGIGDIEPIVAARQASDRTAARLIFGAQSRANATAGAKDQCRFHRILLFDQQLGQRRRTKSHSMAKTLRHTTAALGRSMKCAFALFILKLVDILASMTQRGSYLALSARLSLEL